jgi:hypothetical protein
MQSGNWLDIIMQAVGIPPPFGLSVTQQNSMQSFSFAHSLIVCTIRAKLIHPTKDSQSRQL